MRRESTKTKPKMETKTIEDTQKHYPRRATTVVRWFRGKDPSQDPAGVENKHNRLHIKNRPTGYTYGWRQLHDSVIGLKNRQGLCTETKTTNPKVAQEKAKRSWRQMAEGSHHAGQAETKLVLRMKAQARTTQKSETKTKHRGVHSHEQNGNDKPRSREHIKDRRP